MEELENTFPSQDAVASNSQKPRKHNARKTHLLS